jgi:tetratricopeptide (TPR) repeat protein
MKNHSQAIVDFEQAISLDKESSVGHFYLGTSKLKSNQVDEAIRDFNESDRHDNNQENPGIFDGLGQCYHKIKEFEKAISYFKMALEKEPKNVDFLVNRALCYYDMQEYESSIDDLN